MKVLQIPYVDASPPKAFTSINLFQRLVSVSRMLTLSEAMPAFWTLMSSLPQRSSALAIYFSVASSDVTSATISSHLSRSSGVKVEIACSRSDWARSTRTIPCTSTDRNLWTVASPIPPGNRTQKQNMIKLPDWILLAAPWSMAFVRHEKELKVIMASRTVTTAIFPCSVKGAEPAESMAA